MQEFIDKSIFKGTPLELAEENELLRQEVAVAEKSKAIATLASGMAHEIRNPLTAINTFFEQFPDKRDDPRFMEDFRRLAGGEIKRIENLVNQLLEFAKPSSLVKQRVDVHRILDHVITLLRARMTRQGITVVTNFKSGNALFITADAGKLEQVFFNLILNAIEAMPKGGTLTVNTLANPSTITVEINDTGEGISGKDIQRIFDPFYTKKEGGTGLGLAVVQSIVEEHGGEIGIASTPGKGTEFAVRLPAVPPA